MEEMIISLKRYDDGSYRIHESGKKFDIPEFIHKDRKRLKLTGVRIKKLWIINGSDKWRDVD